MTTRADSLRRFVRRATAPALVAGAALAGACAEVGTDPNEPFSIEFSRLPSPSILLGDTLRDLEGNPVDLRTAATVFNASNDPLDGFPVTFLVTDDSSRIEWDEETGFLVSTDTTGLASVGIQATAGNLVPAPLTLTIIPAAPDSIADADTGFAKIIFVSDAPRVTDRSLKARLLAGTTPVSSWPVLFRVVSLPPILDSVRFIASSTDTLRSSPYDTTSSGIADRFVRAWLKPGTPSGALDTLVVSATFRVRRDSAGAVLFKVPLGVNRTAAP
jgi:hypothetical protein